MAAPVRIFMSAGEASGDLYGALLVQALRERLGPGECFSFGCGGDRMRAAGCRTVVDAHRIAMVGLMEVIPGLPRVWKALRVLVEAIQRERPDLAVLIDFPDFNLRLARELRRAGIPVLYFVAPQVWAWRRGRLRTIQRYVDRLLCIFPFEEAFFQKGGVPAEFVGHPLVGRVAPTLTAPEFRSRFGFPDHGPLVALLPGSRHKEIRLNLPPMLQTARRLAAEGPLPHGCGSDGLLETAERVAAGGECCFVLPAASTTTGEWIRSQIAPARRDGLSVIVVEDHTYDAIAHSCAALVASGTAAIETALLGTPMVIVYRVSAATWWLGRWLVQTPFYSMVNLVAGRRVVPEFIQDAFQPEAVARELRQLMDYPVVRERMRQELQAVTEKLRPPSKERKPPGSFGVPQESQNEDAIQQAVAIAESMVNGRRGARIGNRE